MVPEPADHPSPVSQKSVNSQHIETLSPRYHTIETVSVPRTKNVQTSLWVSSTNEKCSKGKGGGVATIYSNTLSISQKTGFKYNSFEVLVLHITLSREKSINDKPTVMFQIKSLLLSHHHSTSALVSEILMSVLQTVQKTKQKTTVYIWTVHIYRLYRRQCAKYTYIYSVHIVYYKDIIINYTLYTVCAHLHYVHYLYIM